uniref:Reverse transcriptase domain-containing protein n=1 Tax=Heterorhabditis bacteriophora TaxID=37862 RepID=A0A1I7WDJ1_HETBA
MSLSHRLGVDKLRAALPSLDVVAVSKAPSPESNPYSPLPVITMTTIRLIGQTLSRIISGLAADMLRYSESTNYVQGRLVCSNNCTPSEVGALISRITAVIQKYYRINDICSNEPFAVSPLVEQYILLRKHINQSDKWVVTDNTRFSPVFPKPSKRFLTLPFNSCNFHEIPVHHQKFVGTIPARKFLAPVSKSNRITGQNHKSQILSWSDTTIFTNHPSNHRKFTLLRDNTNLLYWPQPVKSQSTIPFNTVIATNGCYE